MAPGSAKEDVSSPQVSSPVSATDSSSSSLTPSYRDLQSLSPRIQKLIREFDNLPWFERTFGFQAPIVWFNVYAAVVGHLLALFGALRYGPQATWTSWIFYLFLYLFSGLGVTAGVHRYWSHKSYKARMPFQIALMVFNCISMQNDIIEWCRDHRVHHKYTETNADPHNALRGFFFAHMGWLMMKKHPDVFIKGKNVEISDLKADPVVRFQHRYYLKLCFLFSLFLPTIIPWLVWKEDLVVSFFILFLFRYIMTLHSTWFVNSAAHLWGERRYDGRINPSDNRFVCVASIGEGWHNYHHTFPHDYATSEWGPRINMTTIILDLMAAIGLVYDRKQASQDAIDRVRRRLGDLSKHATHSTSSLVQ